MEEYDVAIIGGGPAGSAAALRCARSGLRTLVLERDIFPRDKVCGDCINPNCWTIFRELGVDSAIRELPHSRIRRVRFSSDRAPGVDIDLPARNSDPEIAVKRSLLDHRLLHEAEMAGARVLTATPLTAIEPGWKLHCSKGEFHSRCVVAADGRNSPTCRMIGIKARSSRKRVAMQAHLPIKPEYDALIGLHISRQGYCGYADIGAGILNVCLVGKPRQIPRLKQWARQRFLPDEAPVWRSVTPIARASRRPERDSLFLAGDAARVVEPFTGEGIYYALATGLHVADSIVSATRGQPPETPGRDYLTAWSKLYSGRLWINQLARLAVTNPSLAYPILHASRKFPAILNSLTSKVVATKR